MSSETVKSGLKKGEFRNALECIQVKKNYIYTPIY